MEEISKVNNCGKYRNIVFTINNYTDADLQYLTDAYFKYVIYGKEVGKKKNTPHIQGYGELRKQMTLKELKKILPRAYIAARRGSQEQAISYCKKELDYTEIGQKCEQGKRNDLIRLYNSVIEGKSYRDILLEESPNAQELRVIDKAFTYLEKPRNFKTEVLWITGKTGSGKSRYALENYPGSYVKDDTKWWDGYDRHETVIWDDFRGSNIKFSTFLRLLDRYEFRGEVKGGYRQITPKTIVITSIYRPEDCYRKEPEDMNQLLRRIDKIIVLKSDDERIKDRMSGNNIPTSY